MAKPPTTKFVMTVSVVARAIDCACHGTALCLSRVCQPRKMGNEPQRGTGVLVEAGQAHTISGTQDKQTMRRRSGLARRDGRLPAVHLEMQQTAAREWVELEQSGHGDSMIG